MLRPLRFRRLWIALGVLGVVAVLVVCLVPTVPGPQFSGADKLEHVIAYLVLTSWFAALVERRGYAWVALALLAFGVSIEFAQSWMAVGRQGDWHDVLANVTGISIGMLIAASSRDSWLARVEKWLPTR